MNFGKLVKSIKPYSVRKGRFRIRLDKNESPFDVPCEIKEKIMEAIKKEEWNRYPDIDGNELREAIAEFYGIKKENVAVGNGSDEILSILPKIFEGSKAITTPPTFSMYKHYLKINGTRNIEIPLKEDFSLPVNSIIEKIDKDTKAVFICNPNNPTGNAFDRNKIKRIAETGVATVIDEAYAEFSETKSFVQEAVSGKNIIVLKTMSKAFSIAGLRIGYAISNEEIIKMIYRLKSPFSVNRLSVRAAIELLKNYEIIKKEIISKIIAERDFMLKALPPKTACKSETNFVLIDLNAFEFLLERGILVRNFDGRLRKHIRVTIGKKEENREVLHALEEFVEKSKMDRI